MIEREIVGQDDSFTDDDLKNFQSVLNEKDFWERSLVVPMAVDDFPLFRCVSNNLLCHCEGTWYLFHNMIYSVVGDYSGDQRKLLVQEAFDSERRKFERLKRKFDSADAANEKSSRQQIPEAVRIAVWRRDGGKCSKCGSREKLEYDHIIPVSRGGANTVRNIELLCEICNRAKSNHIE